MSYQTSYTHRLQMKFDETGCWKFMIVILALWINNISVIQNYSRYESSWEEKNKQQSHPITVPAYHNFFLAFWKFEVLSSHKNLGG